MDECCKKVSESTPAFIASHKWEESILHIHRTFPKWLSVVPLGNSQYIKLSKSCDFTDILRQLSEDYQKEKSAYELDLKLKGVEVD